MKRNVKWGDVWKNISLLKGLTAEEKCFVWIVTQDMLAVGNKIHRPNPEMRCLAVFVNGEVCVEIQGLEHLFFRGFMNV